MRQYKPLGLNILAIQADDERITNSYGLIANMGGVVHKRPEIATVVAIGSDVTDIKIGDSLFFSKYAGVRLDTDNNNFLLLSRNEIFGVNNNKLIITMGETKDLMGIMENIGKLIEAD